MDGEDDGFGLGFFSQNNDEGEQWHDTTFTGYPFAWDGMEDGPEECSDHSDSAARWAGVAGQDESHNDDAEADSSGEDLQDWPHVPHQPRRPVNHGTANATSIDPLPGFPAGSQASAARKTALDTWRPISAWYKVPQKMAKARTPATSSAKIQQQLLDYEQACSEAQ